jgi:hypothetical protein
VLHRVIAGGIVIFWAVMTWELARMQLFPGKSGQMTVPVEHVIHLMFVHEQASDLVVSDAHERIGALHLQPHRAPASAGAPAEDSLNGSGSIAIKGPGANGQHFNFRWTMSLGDHEEEVRQFDFTATLSAPSQKTPALVIVCDGSPRADHYHYQVRSGTAVLFEDTGTLAALLNNPSLRALGFNAATITALSRQQADSVKIDAHRGVLHANGEDLETYDVTIRDGDAFESTVQFSQLGQVLAATAFAGYSLRDESLAP